MKTKQILIATFFIASLAAPLRAESGAPSIPASLHAHGGTPTSR